MRIFVSCSFALTACCGPTYMRLDREPQAAASTEWICPAYSEGQRGTLSGECREAVIDDTEWNRSGTTRAPLPDCPNGFARLRVGGDTVLVQCAAPDAGGDTILVPGDAGATPSPDATTSEEP